MKTSRLPFFVLPILMAFVVITLIAAIPGAEAPVQAISSVQQTLSQDFSEFVVVRASYTDETSLTALLAWDEPWEVNRREGYIVIGIQVSEVPFLESLGFAVEVDARLTDLYSQPFTRLPGQTSGIPGFACYRTVEETYSDAAQIAADHPDLAEWIDIGDSWDKTSGGGEPGYDLMVLVLTNENTTGDKPKLFIMSSVHAREYTPAELSTRFAEYLVNNYNRDADVTWLLDYHEIHLLLQANPDGRKIAQDGILWRKNTNQDYCRVNENRRGVDLNRNFSFSWNECDSEDCSSSNQCYTTYRGPSAASEPETQAIENYVRGIFPDQREDPINDAAPVDATGIFMDMHSYGRLVLWPWGFPSANVPNGTAYQTLGRKFAYFNDYEPQQAVDLYPTDGATDDFAYGELGVAAFTFELGTMFFEQCSAFENTILPDNLPALLYAAKAARAPYQLPSGPDAVNLTASPSIVAPGGALTISATIDDTLYSQNSGVELTQTISTAEFYLDVPPWDLASAPVAVLMTPVDGAFDSTTEIVQAAVGTQNLNIGRHTIFVRGRDQAGNWGPISAVFVEVIPLQAGFTSTSPDLLGESTVFNNTSGGLDLNPVWDFGDGSPLSTVESPAHVYAAGGDYTVTLTITSTLGMDVYTDTVEIWDDIFYFPLIGK